MIRIPPLFRLRARAAAFPAAALLAVLLVGLFAVAFAPCARAAGPEVVLRGADGAALLTLKPRGSLRFDGAALRGDLALERLELQSPWLRGAVTGLARARIAADAVVFERLELRMERAELLVQRGPQTGALVAAQAQESAQESGRKLAATQEGGAFTASAETSAPAVPVALTLTGAGSWIPARGELRLERARLELRTASGRTLTLTGGLRWSAAAGLDADLALDAPDAGALSALLAAVFPASLSGMTLSGPLGLDLRLVLPPAPASPGAVPSVGGALATDAPRVGLRLRRALELRLPGAAPDSGTLPLPRLRAELAWSPGAGEAWRAEGRVDVQGTLASGGLELDAPSLRFAGFSERGAYHLERARFSCAGAAGPAGVRAALPELALSGALLPRADAGWDLRDLRLSLPGGTLAGAGGLDADGNLALGFFSPGLDLAALTPVLGVLSGLEGWTGQGRLAVDGTLRTDPEDVHSDVRLSLRDAGYASPDGLDLGQGLGAALRLRTRLSLRTLRRWVNAELRLDKGEALFGATYLDFAAHPLRLAANANQLGMDRFKDLRAELDWTGFGTLRAEGDLWAHGAFDDWRFRGGAEAADVSMGPVFDAFAAAPRGLDGWRGKDAGLGGTGALRLAVNADGTTADLEGRLRLTNASLRSADGRVDVRGAYLDLPLTYRLKGRAKPPTLAEVPEERLGSLRIARLRTPWSARENFAVRMALVPNRFFLLDPIRIPLFGGRIRLDNLRCDAPLSREFRLSVDARFRDIDLSQWSRRSVPLSGVLHGDLGRITATRKRVEAPGAVEGDFFGGAVHADGFFMDWPLEARRQFGGRVAVRGLDLERLSSALGVGRVTGLLDLELKDLLFAYGQPASLSLRAETTGRGDFEKRVSLKAVNSLSVLGTGTGIGDVGVGLFASFFESFSYARIGFQCVLNNDRFQIRGLIRDGGTEYLIRKPFLTGISVVNGNPENFISFADMLERVQRVVTGSPPDASRTTP